MVRVEEWKELEGFPKYQISNLGKFRVEIKKIARKTLGYFNTKEEAYSFAHLTYKQTFGFEPWSNE